MSEVYLVCSNVDLGYHVEYAYLSEHSAIQKVNEMNAEYVKLKINDLMKGCKYSKEDAVKWVQTNSDEYFLQVVKLTKE
jgi:hypothetical protein